MNMNVTQPVMRDSKNNNANLLKHVPPLLGVSIKMIHMRRSTPSMLGTIGICLLAAILAGCSDSTVTSGATAHKNESDAPEVLMSTKESNPATGPVALTPEPTLSIVQTAGGLTVSSPNGGEKWKTGKSYPIKWTKGQAGGTVKIQLLKSGKHYRWVTKKTKNDGTYVWKIPSTVPAGAAYKIRIVSRKSRKVFDKSNKSFRISAAADGSDGLDLNKVTWLHTKTANWPQTSTLKVTFKGANICMTFADAKKWPSVSILHTSGKKYVKVNANPWVFVKRGGKWYGGTWEWMAPGRACKPKKAVAGDHIKKSPLKSWRPRSGETVYIMVSALARAGKRNNFAARTNAVKVVWR